MPTRIAQLSDAHLSPRYPRFEGNFDRVADSVRDARPDLVIATGDLSLDGADDETDLRHAGARHAAIGFEFLAIPGNHDVGDDAVLGGRQPVNAERLDRWRRVFGGLGFVHDVPGWRLIGLDTQSLGVPESAPQWAMLEAALDGAGGRRLALFLHKPLTEERLDDTAVNYWPVLPAARARLLALFGANRPAFVASGHVHQQRTHRNDGLLQLWAPAIGFIVGDAWQKPVGAKTLGWVEHVLHADGTAEHQVHLPSGMDAHDIGLMPEVYGPLSAAG
ncbi:MAG: metallophosphoesterase [Rubritepida sp.]|nr:metallophosphoesterase [Rubritepida sp.]